MKDCISIETNEEINQFLNERLPLLKACAAEDSLREKHHGVAEELERFYQKAKINYPFLLIKKPKEIAMIVAANRYSFRGRAINLTEQIVEFDDNIGMFSFFSARRSITEPFSEAESLMLVNLIIPKVKIIKKINPLESKTEIIDLKYPSNFPTADTNIINIRLWLEEFKVRTNFID